MKPKNLSESNRNSNSAMISVIDPTHKHSNDFNMNVKGFQGKHIANPNKKSQEFSLPEKLIESLEGHI